VVAGARSRDHAGLGGARHRVRPLQPARQGVPHGSVDASQRFATGDIRAVIPRFTPEAREANQAVVDLVRRIADAEGATPAQVALAWLLARAPWIAPIPGTRRLGRLEENLGAADLSLTPEDLAELDEASWRIEVQGERYPEQMQRMIDR
jgi:aryl-alcohol dehydrogenase-like predicted oxidoreductase